MTGELTASGGSTYQLGGTNGLPTTATLNLTSGTLSLGGYNQTLGALTVGSGASIIDFGSAASALVFGDSHLKTWSGTLTITNYTSGSGESLKFGVDASALTVGQLSALTFSGYSLGGQAQINGSGFVTPLGSAIPEPATYAAIAGALSLLLALRRRSRDRSRSS